jgi:hypothetical protein
MDNVCFRWEEKKVEEEPEADGGDEPAGAESGGED